MKVSSARNVVSTVSSSTFPAPSLPLPSGNQAAGRLRGRRAPSCLRVMASSRPYPIDEDAHQENDPCQPNAELTPP